jgi:sterol desaturase/sphingolipid hydroxylase (fatty acid hydroxylase superfamily)
MLYGVVFMILLLFYGAMMYFTRNHKNYQKREIENEYYIITFINILIGIVFAFLLITFHERLFAFDHIFDIKMVLFYLVLIDTLYYWVHRITHRIPSLRALLHSTHHSLFDLLPLDFLYESPLEYSMYTFLTSLFPLFFLSVTIWEYGFIILISLIHVIYCHADMDGGFILPMFIDSAYHRDHHQRGRGNYSILFPTWDHFMKTRIPSATPSSVKKE